MYDEAFTFGDDDDDDGVGTVRLVKDFAVDPEVAARIRLLTAQGTKAACKTALRGANKLTDKEECILETFREWDIDGSGSISCKEFATVMKELVPGQSEGDLDRMAIVADTNGDGSIDYEEFVSWICQAPHVARFFETYTTNEEARWTQLVNEVQKAKSPDEIQWRIDEVNKYWEAENTRALRPLVYAAFDYHDKDESGYLEEDESILFFSSYIDWLCQHIYAVVRSRCQAQTALGLVNQEEADAIVAEIVAMIEAFFQNADSCYVRAFKYLDTNGDGRLCREETCMALLPGEASHEKFVEALGLYLQPQDD